MRDTRLVAPSPAPPARRPKRVGHMGAHALVPGNTIESFRAARALGVDMIEFDVLRAQDGRLVLAHDFEDAAARRPVSLEEGLDHLAGPAYAGVELDVDLKLPGYEREVAEALDARELSARTLVSTVWPESLDRLGELAPGLRRGWSVPKARRDYMQARRTAVPAHVMLAYGRRVLPRRAGAMLRAGRCEAIMAYHRLVTPALVRAIRVAGGQLYAWTVDEPDGLRRLTALGVDGLISNDPRLFQA
jgi:glycerophosphoryl diester phosphodiesterase